MNDGKDFARQARAFPSDNSSAGPATFKCDINPKLVTLSELLQLQITITL